MQLKKFVNKNILITGGLGFIGSNLAIKLANEGAKVTVADAMIPGYGGNLFNIEEVKDKITINFSDIRDEYSMAYLVQGKDFIFHLAAQVSHVMSLSDPFPDIDINIKGTAVLLEACKKYNKDAVVIRAGTRGQYGDSKLLPVKEDAPTNPKGIYEVSQLTSEKIMQVYHHIHGIRCVMPRLTNVYGPRSQMQSSSFGVANWFIRIAIDGGTIKVFGDGKIKRDFLYADDCVDALLLLALNENCYGEVFNVGDDTPSNFLELTETLCRLETKTKWEFAPFTPERAAQEPGDFYSDISKIESFTGWRPKTSLEAGLKKTIDYYKKFKGKYWQ